MGRQVSRVRGSAMPGFMTWWRSSGLSERPKQKRHDRCAATILRDKRRASQAIEQRLDVRVPFGDLLDKYSTLDLLADHLEQSIPQDKDLSVPPAPRRNPVPVGPGAVRIGAHGELEGVLAVPLTDAQKELWYATLVGDKASCVFNESTALCMRGSFDAEAMRKAIQDLVQRHEALRTSISPVGDEQQIYPRARIEVPLIDLSQLEPNRRETEFNALM